MNNQPEVKQREEDELIKFVDGQTDRLLSKITKHLPDTLNSNLLLLKSHLLAEYYLGLLLMLHDENYKILEGTFHTKLEKIEAGKLLRENRLESLRRLNKLRNRMAHELEYQISESDIDYIGAPIGKPYVVERLERDTPDDLLLRWVLIKIILFIAVAVTSKLFTEKRKNK